MWGHLKAADFINLIEGHALPLKRRSHLQSCARCTEAFVSAQKLHSKLAESALNDDEIPEPDWFQFRADVRNSMLSRAAQRQSKAVSGAGWTGWLTRPAMSWGLAVAFAAGLSAGLLMWNRPAAQPQIQTKSSPVAVAPVENADSEQLTSLDRIDTISEYVAQDSSGGNIGITALDQSSVFDEFSQLNDAQVERLQHLLEEGNGASRQ